MVALANVAGLLHLFCSERSDDCRNFMPFMPHKQSKTRARQERECKTIPLIRLNNYIYINIICSKCVMTIKTGIVENKLKLNC